MAKKESGEVSNPKAAELEETYKKTITFKCPVRGIVTQEVEVKKYKSQPVPEHKQVDPEISELLDSELYDADDLDS